MSNLSINLSSKSTVIQNFVFSKQGAISLLALGLIAFGGCALKGVGALHHIPQPKAIGISSICTGGALFTGAVLHSLCAHRSPRIREITSSCPETTRLNFERLKNCPKESEIPIKERDSSYLGLEYLKNNEICLYKDEWRVGNQLAYTIYCYYRENNRVKQQAFNYIEIPNLPEDQMFTCVSKEELGGRALSNTTFND